MAAIIDAQGRAVRMSLVLRHRPGWQRSSYVWASQFYSSDHGSECKRKREAEHFGNLAKQVIGPE